MGGRRRRMMRKYMCNMVYGYFMKPDIRDQLEQGHNVHVFRVSSETQVLTLRAPSAASGAPPVDRAAQLETSHESGARCAYLTVTRVCAFTLRSNLRNE